MDGRSGRHHAAKQQLPRQVGTFHCQGPTKQPEFSMGSSNAANDIRCPADNCEKYVERRPFFEGMEGHARIANIRLKKCIFPTSNSICLLMPDFPNKTYLPDLTGSIADVTAELPDICNPEDLAAVLSNSLVPPTSASPDRYWQERRLFGLRARINRPSPQQRRYKRIWLISSLPGRRC